MTCTAVVYRECRVRPIMLLYQVHISKGHHSWYQKAIRLGVRLFVTWHSAQSQTLSATDFSFDTTVSFIAINSCIMFMWNLESQVQYELSKTLVWGLLFVAETHSKLMISMFWQTLLFFFFLDSVQQSEFLKHFKTCHCRSWLYFHLQLASETLFLNCLKNFRQWTVKKKRKKRDRLCQWVINHCQSHIVVR
jgi:hypothetical protein